MISSLRLPKTLLWVLNLLILYILLFTSFRCLTVLLFKPQGETLSMLWPSFILGFRFDLRWISLLLFPIVTAGMVPQLSPYHSPRNKKIWTWYLAITTFWIVLIYTIDFGCFAYYHVRLGATVLNFADDAAIASRMLWESYPVVWMISGLMLTVILLRALFSRLHHLVTAKTEGQEILYKKSCFVLSITALAFLVYGSFPSPLHWKRRF